jgi:hypothetical protein
LTIVFRFSTIVFRFSKMREHLRQLRYPQEFRIPESIEPAQQTNTEREPDTAKLAPPPTELADGAVADLATSLWRTKRKLDTGDGQELPQAQRAAARHLLVAWETFEDAGVKIQDHDGIPFDPGLALDVVTYEKRSGVTKEIVLETVRPSVYRSGRCIQLGQVIVAQPEES